MESARETGAANARRAGVEKSQGKGPLNLDQSTTIESLTGDRDKVVQRRRLLEAWNAVRRCMTGSTGS